MNPVRLLLPTLVAGCAAVLLLPPESSPGFTKIGSLLGFGQLDFRVRNQFADAATNNNQVPHSQYPGWFGAEMALWKSASEWASQSHGDGTGDPTQANIGDGGANFDFTWQGTPMNAGGSNDNIVGVLGNCGGNTLAFVQTPVNNGWTMKFCDNWVWSDGPGFAPGGQFDLQGVGTHEFGHSLGLGHSAPGTVMQPSTASGNDTRNLSLDDRLGVQCVYGARTAVKVEITGVSITGHEMTITGANFDPTNSEVWFTNRTISNPIGDPRIRVNGLEATNGGTQIVVCIPPDAGSGDVLARRPGQDGDDLSNAFPVTIPDPVTGDSTLHNGTGCNQITFAEVTPAVIGANWVTTVALQPGQTQTRVAVSLNGGTCHAGGFKPGRLNGTELLALPPYVKPHSSSNDGNHSLAVSNDCLLIGEQFCTQGFGLSFGPIQIEAFNALLVTVGNTN